MIYTVAIATYNRANSLYDTLTSLTSLQIPAVLAWELLLIDNNCTDRTKEVCDRFASELPMRYLSEPSQGLSHARNRALAEARGEVVVFTDDDVILSPGWLAAYAQAVDDFPDAAYFGGKIVPTWPAGKPRWVRDVNMPLLAGLFGSYDLGPERRLYSDTDMHPYGANFALRRSLFERLGDFRTDLGMRGNVPGRGEEAEYFKRAKERGFTGAYVPEAMCQHRVDPRHLTLSYLYRFGVQKGVASGTIHPENSRRINKLAGWRYLVAGVSQLLKGRGDRFRQCVINLGIQHGLRSKDYESH